MYMKTKDKYEKSTEQGIGPKPSIERLK